MAASHITITVSAHPFGAQRIVCTDDRGHVVGELDLPVGYEVRVVPAPWWRRLRTWLRLQWWRAGVAWGA